MERANLHPSIVTFGTLIDGCRKDKKRAIRFFDKMKSCRIRPDTRIMNYLINALRDDPQQSEERFREMLQLKLKPDRFTWMNLERSFKSCPGKLQQMQKLSSAQTQQTFGSRPSAPSGTCFEFVRTGHCKFGHQCKYSHSNQTNVAPCASSSTSSSAFSARRNSANHQSSSRLPPGTCFYFRTGHCKFGHQCKYLHSN